MAFPCCRWFCCHRHSIYVPAYLKCMCLSASASVFRWLPVQRRAVSCDDHACSWQHTAARVSCQWVQPLLLSAELPIEALLLSILLLSCRNVLALGFAWSLACLYVHVWCAGLGFLLVWPHPWDWLSEPWICPSPSLKLEMVSHAKLGTICQLYQCLCSVMLAYKLSMHSQLRGARS